MEETQKITRKLPNQEVDYYKIAKILLSRWYWIAASVLICTLISYIYLWYTPKTYATTATLKIEEKKSEFSDLVGIINNNDRGPSKIQSEIFVLQSRTLILNAIRDIDYRITFFISGRVRTSDVYPQKLLNIHLLKFDSTNFFRDIISFKPVSSSSFGLSYKLAGKPVNHVFNYDSPITIANTSFSIQKPGELAKNTIFMFKFNVPEDFIGRVKGGLRTSEIVKNSNIISLQETDSNPQFAADMLNAIMREYLSYDKNLKTQSATNMIRFIDNQLELLSNEVQGSEKSIEKFKKNSKIMDVTSATDLEFSKIKDLESQRSLLKIQLIAIDQLRDQIMKEKDNVSLNLNLEGVIDPLLGSLVQNLDNLLNEKSTLLKTYNANSQVIRDIDRQILQIKNAALNNIEGTSTRINKNIDYLDAQAVKVNQKIATLPAAERDLISLKRDFEINDKVYSFLSEKRLDAQISRSAILPGATVIEPAEANFSPVSPDEHTIHRTALIAGVAIGLGLIILIRVLNPYIYDKETVESLTTIPIIGVIRKFPDEIDEDNTQILAVSRPKSIFAESVRSVRTNLNFIASEKSSKIICITSEIAGEGKSFIAVNLSSTLSLIDKKIILIAADLRRSRLHKTFHLPNDVGLSNFLANQCTVDDVIRNTSQPNLDILLSGPVPPNPSELLHSKRMKELITELKKRYDIIMIDTAPIGLVSDSIPLIRMSDINIFVIRSGKSKYYAATVPQRIANEYHLDNTVIILNAFAEDLLHSRYYTTKFTGEYTGSHYYYYSDYSGYEGSDYYVDKKKFKWWDIRRWLK
ncbi:GumC family protein [Mucilaginibacter ginsenosidivorans]|uniref:non-specific protein-tyrosine kinase n=1 Tax=Mucilaginibacter ginsenosidivorans TaxID=398053 RepID=A0A5B8UU32_9SPHI|nr:tyrosine-protein kinase family protein [Mucilaginibacter ginsenosidivorans]QEC62554.1 polysaccharide biosynthesis tyrosine autokinase [Mucilaginibacter ginsenosidivorans]